MLPTFIYPISYTLIDTFLVVFIKATSINGKTTYNTITINAITEFIKLCIAIYIAHDEGSLHSLRSIVTDPGLMIRFAIPNLMYAVNNNVFHYSIGALPPAVFVVAINAFRTVITAILQPCVSNKALTTRQILACILLMLSFVFASLPEVIKVAFSGAIKGSTLELLLYLAGIYSIISVTASLAQEKLLKDSKSLMVANIINYSIGITFQLSGMFYEKCSTPDSDLFRGLDVFWVRAIPFLMAIVGLSISYVLKYYDNIVKLLCSSVSVLLVNTITAFLAGESLFNAYFLVGWLMTLPATYLYYVAPHSPSSDSKLPTSSISSRQRNDKQSFSTELDDEERKTLLEPKSDFEKKPLDTHSNRSVEKQNDLKHWFETIPKNRIIFGGIATSLVILSVFTSTFDLNKAEENSVITRTGHAAHYNGIEDVEETCSLFEVPYVDPRNNLRVIDTFHANYGRQYVTVDYITGDLFVSCSKDMFITGPDSDEFRTIVKMRTKDRVSAGSDAWYKLSSADLETVKSWDSVNSLYSMQRGGFDSHYQKEEFGHSMNELTNSSIEERSRILLQSEKFKRLSWSFVDEVVGSQAQFFWLWCADYTDANLVVRPPVLGKIPQPPQSPLTPSMRTEIEEYIKYLSVTEETHQSTSTEKVEIEPVYDTVLVLYLDAVSRIKFEKFFERSRKVLESMMSHSSDSSREFIHNSVELKKLHAIGINSEKNYPQFLSGVSSSDTKRFYHKNKEELLSVLAKAQSVSPTDTWLKGILKNTSVDEFLRREPWIFDIAELAGFTTLSGVTNCPRLCNNNCHDLSTKNFFYEQGGFHAQYMNEANHRMPGRYNFPTASYCESLYRPTLRNHACSTCDSPNLHSKVPDPSRLSWIGNKLGMSYVLDWWRVWLASTANAGSSNRSKKQPRFGVIVFEETHQQDFLDQFDMELANFIHDLTFSSKNRHLFGTERLAMVVMADHGLHFTAEFKVSAGKIANKQPFGYIIAPRPSHSDTTSKEREHMNWQNLLRNSHALTTAFDIRATVLYWLTGREWSAREELINHKQYTDTRRLKRQRFKHQVPKDSKLSQQAPNQQKSEYSFELATKLKNKVFASNHGLNLMTDSVPFNRTCLQAGIPTDFCACNLQPCNGYTKQLVHDSAKRVVKYINRRISDIAPHTLSVCKPLHVSELIFVPGLDDCLASTTSLVVNAYIKRNLKLISITYIYDNDYRSDSHQWHRPGRQPKLRVANVNTISNYGKIWKQCQTKFESKNITHSIPDDSFQFCYCVDDFSWASTAVGFVNALNF